MGIFKNIFTWWEGSTFGTWLNTTRKGTKVGEIQATMPTGEQTIEIITGAKIEEPGFGWRFTHPGELLGL